MVTGEDHQKIPHPERSKLMEAYLLMEALLGVATLAGDCGLQQTASLTGLQEPWHQREIQLKGNSESIQSSPLI